MGFWHIVFGLYGGSPTAVPEGVVSVVFAGKAPGIEWDGKA